MRTINPATEEPVGDYAEHKAEQVRQRLQQASAAFAIWRNVPLEDRGRLMRRAGALLGERKSLLSGIMTAEMGKPITAAEAEIEKCSSACDYFAENAARFLAVEQIQSSAPRSSVRYEPIGAVLGIMPWNFPYWQVFRFAVPTLMAGNIALLKHAPNVPGCALAIEAIFRDSGFPAGVFTTLLIDTPAVEAIINEPIVQAVTLTGSSRAGSIVAAQADKALRKAVLELGGSDPFIVLPDAEIASTAKAAAEARCVNAGQSCIAAKRFIVVGPNPRFEKEFASALAALRVGDPLDRRTQVGPLARRDLLENLQRQVRESIDAGARLVVGGHVLPGKGNFYSPTLLADVRPGMAVFDEETFGPVAALVRARDVDEAIRLANQSAYGLGASIWTQDPAAAEQIAPRVDSGMVFINGPVQSDPRLPFGGIKQSGHGRELSAAGIREFTNCKTIWVGNPTQTPEVELNE